MIHTDGTPTVANRRERRSPTLDDRPAHGGYPDPAHGPSYPTESGHHAVGVLDPGDGFALTRGQVERLRELLFAFEWDTEPVGLVRMSGTGTVLATRTAGKDYLIAPDGGYTAASD